MRLRQRLDPMERVWIPVTSSLMIPLGVFRSTGVSPVAQVLSHGRDARATFIAVTAMWNRRIDQARPTVMLLAA